MSLARWLMAANMVLVTPRTPPIAMTAPRNQMAMRKTAELRFDPAARVVAAREAGDRIEVEVAARGPALLVVATTHDPGWSAARGGEALSVLQSGAGYLAVPLPPGGGTVRLVYRDPWLRPGAAVSGAALVALLGLAFARRRPKPAPAAP